MESEEQTCKLLRTASSQHHLTDPFGPQSGAGVLPCARAHENDTFT